MEILLGDFNRCDIATHLPHLEQYVTSVTRLDKTLDLCYGNIPSAYISKSRPPLGRSDHNAVLLLPRYKQKLKSEKVQTRTVQVWDFDSTEKLRGCFEATDWDVFFKDCGNDIDMLNASISGYIDFCVDSVIPVKNVRCYPNNKPWVTKELKHFLNLKKIAFLNGDRNGFNTLQKDLKLKIKEAKQQYKHKVEEKFTTGNARVAWQGLNKMMGRNQK